MPKKQFEEEKSFSPSYPSLKHVKSKLFDKALERRKTTQRAWQLTQFFQNSNFSFIMMYHDVLKCVPF